MTIAHCIICYLLIGLVGTLPHHLFMLGQYSGWRGSWVGFAWVGGGIPFYMDKPKYRGSLSVIITWPWKLLCWLGDGLWDAIE